MEPLFWVVTFTLGFFVGGAVVSLIMSLCVVAKKADTLVERHFNETLEKKLDAFFIEEMCRTCELRTDPKIDPAYSFDCNRKCNT